MVQNIEVARQTAHYLLQIKAIQFDPQNPFTWSSGLKAPVYCDNRKSLAYPAIRQHIQSQLATLVQNQWPNTELIAGVATAGIAHGVLVADSLNLPFAYVRSKKKEHGLNNQIEGAIEKEGMETVVVEDLISTGRSSLNAVSALHQAGCRINGVIAIFDYGFYDTRKTFDDYRISLQTLTDYDTLLQEAEKRDYIQEDEISTLRQWREQPYEWSEGKSLYE